MSLKGSILITGGAGTLGKAIIKRAHKENWDCNITIFSTDAMKHLEVRRQYPHVNSVIGDIRDYTTLYNAMAGKDIVVHAAAVKHIPVSEVHSLDTIAINVEGSQNVLQCAVQHNIPDVIGISTDKACHPANAYGASKYLMEKMFQEYSRAGFPTNFHLVRYGNVLESTGSVIELWKDSVAKREPIQLTDPGMTRFFLSPNQAVDYVVRAMDVASGYILVPKIKSLSIGVLAEYTLENYDGVTVQRVPLRPGEKMHETLLTDEEVKYVPVGDEDFMWLSPTTGSGTNVLGSAYSSDIAPRLTREELAELLRND